MPSASRWAPLFFALALCLCTCDRAPKPDAHPAVVAEAPAAPYQDLSPVEFAERMGEDDVVVLDVRTPGEIAGGKIEGALELDFRSPEFKQQLSELDPDKTYLVYCAAGGRSSQTCTMMNEAGFERLYNLRGGYAAWAQ